MLDFRIRLHLSPSLSPSSVVLSIVMASEFHKADALQCLEVAKKAAKERDKPKAEKFALKAQKLCDCVEVRDTSLRDT